MPFVRDWSFNFGATATATTQAVKLPQYQQNDLLLAICSTDTGTTQAWSSSGWTQLFSVSNTNNLGILWKIAGAAETDPTFTYSIAETANVHLLAIGDVNTTTPFNGTGGAGTGYRTATNSAARVALPVLTTTVNASLVLYINSESGAAVPGVLEGPCTWEDAMDGSAHSHGWSWGFKPTAGAVGADVFANKSGTAAGVIATVGISPPATGATVIPAHCAADASIYVDPIHGVTAYNGNTAFAATVTTNFGTTINGRTLSNGTAAAAADVGLNSYHSMGQITGVTTDGTYAGACTVLATGNKPNVTGKNVLAHVMPSAPKVYQNLDNIAKSTSKGVVFGMASAANNYKFWQVHGFGTGWDSAQHVPIVINSSATAENTTGTLNAASIASFGFAISGTRAAPVMRFGSLWVLDTTTIAGGNAAAPVNVPGVVKAAATGKERMSVLQQGATQMLVLQPLQFGNGGTNGVYLDLSNCAVEFPQQRSVTDGQVYYNSVDNVCGLTFYPGASDTIDIRNCVFSSKSRFKWDWHASMSTAATVYTDGAQVINAGTLNLRAITYSGVSFSGCYTVTPNGATLAGCTFQNSLLELAGVTDFGLVSDSTLSTTQYHRRHPYAVKLNGAAGTVTLDGLNFSGYGAGNSTPPADTYLIPGFAGPDGGLLSYTPSGFVELGPIAGLTIPNKFATAEKKYYDACVEQPTWSSGVSQTAGYAITGWPGIAANQAFTVQAWVMRRSVTSASLSILGGAGSDISFSLNNDGTSGTFWLNTTVRSITISPALSANTWHHLALTRSASSGVVRLFVNGVQMGTYAGSATETAAAPDRFARIIGTSSTNNGLLQDVQYIVGTDLYGGNSFTPPAKLFEKRAIYVLATTGTFTLNVAGGTTPGVFTAGATVTVVSGATVTFTGLPTGTDVVILTAGTTTVLQQVDQHPSTSFSWGYAGTPTVDVGFIKPGYKPRYLRNLALGTSDSSIPVALEVDRAYS